MSLRKGLTVVELLVVIGIIGVLIALILPAILKVRQAALRSESQNQLKQIILATHHFSSTYNGKVPGIEAGRRPFFSTLRAVLPFIEQADASAGQPPHTYFRMVPSYLSAADPTLPGQPYDLSSYAVNAVAFRKNASFNRSFRDGTSSTIGLAEHYSVCQFSKYSYAMPIRGGDARPATFAHKEMGDYYPNPKRGFPAKTFQVAPSINQCDPRLAQTPHYSGMLVAMSDGACRTLSPGVAPYTYWSLVTPAGGEVLRSDW